MPTHQPRSGVVARYAAVIAELTETAAQDWENVNGPELAEVRTLTYVHMSLGYQATVALDHDEETIIVVDEEGFPIASNAKPDEKD